MDFFHDLDGYPQFIAFKISKNKDGKLVKQPANSKNGQIWNAHDKSIWADSETVLSDVKKLSKEYGLGFVLTDQDPFFLLDIDNCYNGEWSELSKKLLYEFRGAAVEISSSRKGLHIIGSYTEKPEHGCRNSQNGIELYTSNRFIALTGTNPTGHVTKICDEPLKKLITEYFPLDNPISIKTSDSWWSDEPHSDWNGPDNDDILIERMLKSQSNKSRFGKLTARFCDLWQANEEILTQVYPCDKNSSDSYNRSAADAALAQHLAFWTGNNAERILRLMMRSSLVRDKWEREDYLPRTIRGACGKCKEYLKDPYNINTENKQISTGTLLNANEQIEYFKDCYYACEENSILVPGGQLLDKERFNVMYGGKTFLLDGANSKTTKSAWEAFTNSQLIKHPKAHGTCFKPALKFGETIVQDGLTYVNSYWPINTPCKKGDVAPFIKHMNLLFKDQKDYKIIMNYIAGLIQYPGVKFSYCPVIQGVEGNGKTLITMIVVGILGKRYCKLPRADEIGNKFNDWQYNTMFAGIEDAIYNHSKLETIEILKPMLTGEWGMIEGKGKQKIMRDLCCNYIMNTNHKDGLRKTRNDRRFAILYTGQQNVEDLERDGMTGEYFTNFRKWIFEEGGLANIHHYFKFEFKIEDEFNPAKGIRAPITSCNEEAIAQSMGIVEQEIQDIIEQECVGFRNGWVSSKALDTLLANIGANRRVPPNKRRELMRSLGYDWHPGLKNGRVSTNMPSENGKPRLYVKIGHKDSSLSVSVEIVKAYLDSQK